MCGIAAFSLREGADIDAELFARLAALGIESRGPDATGVAWLAEDGYPWYSKLPGPASRVVRDLDMDGGSESMIIHTRWSTSGTPKVNDNNHPMVYDGITLVHNGVIYNDRELFNSMGVSPSTDCDSEVLPTLLRKYAELGDDSALEALQNVWGDASIAWLDCDDDARQVNLARLSGRPMVLASIKRWGQDLGMFMSSTEETLTKTTEILNIEVTSLLEVPEWTYIKLAGGYIASWDDIPTGHHYRPKTTGRSLTTGAVQQGLYEIYDDWDVYGFHDDDDDDETYIEAVATLLSDKES